MISAHFFPITEICPLCFSELCPLFPLIYVHHILSMKYTHFLSEVHAHYFHWNIFIIVSMKYIPFTFSIEIWPLSFYLEYDHFLFYGNMLSGVHVYAHFFFQWSMPITWSASSAVPPPVLTPWSLAGWRRKPGLPQSRSNAQDEISPFSRLNGDWMVAEWRLNGDGKGGFQLHFSHHSVTIHLTEWQLRSAFVHRSLTVQVGK